jgi:signal transduction histidine kinase/DNA-binding response OmpR family regulator
VPPVSHTELIDEADLELVRRSIPGAVAYVLLFLVVVWLTPYTADYPGLTYVTGACLTLLGIARIILARKFLRTPTAWGPFAFRIIVFANAATWSTFSAVTLAYYAEQWTTMVVLLMTAGTTAGGLTSLSPNLAVARAFVAIMLLPSILVAAMNGGPDGYAVAFTVAVYAGFLVLESRHQNTSYWRAIEDRATLRLKAQELEEAKKLADAATAAKSSFLANMSHEIRTPMNAVLGMTEVLLESGLDARHERSVRTIQDSTESLLDVINDILDLSKIEAGRLELDSTRFDLRDTVHDVLRTLAFRAHSKGLELSCRVLTSVPDGLEGDAGRLRQILTNLVGNAVKFTSDGTILVQIELKESRGDTALLHFLVSDTGIGIPTEKHELVFEPFSQADNSTTRRYGGSGLGLSISKTLVEMMGGEMWFESEFEKGSTFHFTARFNVRQVDQQRLAGAGIRSLQGRHVLVVEDNPGIRRIISEMLQSWGMRPTIAENSASAADAMAHAATGRTAFSFALIEAEMKDEDGFTISEWILKQPGNVVPIMMLTSVAQNEGATRCRELGIPLYLVKPVSESDLFDAMMTAQGLSKTADKAPVQVTHHPTPELSEKLRILLVEDNAVNQFVAQQMLETRGHSVVIANNGREALEHFTRLAPFDVILMDIQMPEMDGFQTTAAIRNLEQNGRSRTPIIAMTAHAMKGYRERCLAAGMDGYVSKPVHGKALFECIRSLIENTPAATPTAPRTESTVFDRSALLDRLEGDTSVVREIVRVFKQESPRQIAQLRNAIDVNDCMSVANSAHSLKGSLLVLSADRLASAAQKLETMGRSGQLAGATETFEELESGLEALAEALQNMVRELG